MWDFIIADADNIGFVVLIVAIAVVAIAACPPHLAG
jgi:hypothetical protein